MVSFLSDHHRARNLPLLNFNLKQFRKAAHDVRIGIRNNYDLQAAGGQLENIIKIKQQQNTYTREWL